MAASLKKQGARQIYAAITHALLCGPAVERLNRSDLKEIVVTDTIPLDAKKRLKNIKVLSIAPLLAEAIVRIHNEQSVSTLFRTPDDVKKSTADPDEEFITLG